MAKKSKSKIIRHDEPSSFTAPAFLTDKQMDAVIGHIEAHIGKTEEVWHEIISDGVHLDIIPVAPTEERPFKTFVTMGMSAVRLTLPKGVKEPERTELCAILPPGWPTDEKSLKAKGKRSSWPIEGLKELARIPSMFDTYLDMGHTVPNGEPAKPLASTCKFVCWLILPSFAFPDEFAILRTPRFKVHFLQVVPIYKEEMNLVLEEGVETLLHRFDEAEFDGIQMFNPKRPNFGVVRSKR